MIPRKQYTTAIAIDVSGEPLPGDPRRADRVTSAAATWRVPVARTKAGAPLVDLLVDYAFTRHRSNDAFYNYSAHGVGLSVAFGY